MHTLSASESSHLSESEFEYRHGFSYNNDYSITIYGENIEIFVCSYNDDFLVKKLDVSKNTELRVLGCYLKGLRKLDLSNNIALEHLGCNYNRLTSLDLSKNIAIRELHCRANQLSADALNDLFRTLPIVTNGEIAIRENPGENDCDKNIVENKGWTVY